MTEYRITQPGAVPLILRSGAQPDHSAALSRLTPERMAFEMLNLRTAAEMAEHAAGGDYFATFP